MKTLLLLLLLLVSAFASPAGAATLYTEAVQGDFSNAGATPTSLSFEPGTNQIFGTTGRSLLTGVDRDYFTFVVPIGYQWSAIQLLPGTVSGGSLSFIGVQEGPQVTVPWNAADATGLLGWTHYSPAEIGTDLLPVMGTMGFGSTGFTPPLPAGTYSIWVQDNGMGTFAWGFDVQITPASVPEPGTGALVLAALAAGVASRRLVSRARRPEIRPH
jgi:hypothetical protein